MKKVLSIPAAVFIALTASLLTLSISVSFFARHYRDHYQNMFSPAADGSAAADDPDGISGILCTLADIDALARDVYIGEINAKALKNYTIYGYLAGLGDKYAMYMDSDEYTSSMSDNEGRMIGIGINVIYDNTMGGIYVINVTENAPAQRAGVLPGDIITHVDHQNVTELGYYNTVRYIKEGGIGDSLEITLFRGPDYIDKKILTVTRAEIDITTVQSHMTSQDIGVVTISEFNRHTPEEFIAAVHSLQSAGATKFIFDVRNNPGGDLLGIHGVLDFLLPEGPIIRIEGKDIKEQILESDKRELDAPMAVLINENTASAAELFGSALRDYEKATLVGTNTYGKGTMQTVIPLPDGGGLSISTAMYKPPFGSNYEDIGIAPHIEVEMPPELAARFYLLADDEDPQLSKAVELLEGK